MTVVRAEMADADNGGSTKGWLDRIHNIFSSEPQNQKQLLELLKNLRSSELIGADELTMIEGVLQVADMHVRDIMIPRGQMVVLDHEDSFAEIIAKITESGHSRFPVIDDDKDDLVGILLAKDLLTLSLTQQPGEHFERAVKGISTQSQSHGDDRRRVRRCLRVDYHRGRARANRRQDR
jgi:magnesium and cobalt transporter